MKILSENYLKFTDYFFGCIFKTQLKKTKLLLITRQIFTEGI